LEREGRERVLLYRVAFYTGLRRSELLGLQVDHLLLDAEKPSLRVCE
jgi:integrase